MLEEGNFFLALVTVYVCAVNCNPLFWHHKNALLCCLHAFKLGKGLKALGHLPACESTFQIFSAGPSDGA